MTERFTLGGREFEIGRPTLGQLRRLLVALDAVAGSDGIALIDASVELLATALGEKYPDATVDALLDLPATLVELNEAVAAVLRAAGLHLEVAVPGEAAPVAALSAPGLALSTPPSPPDAATIIEPSME